MFKYQLMKYKPIDNVENFYILNNNFNNERYLLYSNYNINYSLQIKNNGYIPKSGLMFAKIIEGNVHKKDVLDLGMGQLGILAVHSVACGANSVVAVDIDDECIQWFEKIVKDNSLESIRIIKSNFFSNIKGKYDIIMSNPPQMPMIEEKMHDSGGFDGRKYIIEILERGKSFLKDKGDIYILVFDFLGTNVRTNNEKSIFEIAKDIGYKEVEIVMESKKYIKEGSVTFNNLSYIQSIYPNYLIKSKNNNLYINIQIIKFGI